jgi:hypothetical protein
MVAASIPVRHKSCRRAIKTRATIRSIVFLAAKARPFDSVDFISRGRALDRGQRMVELWNYWYDILASAEALAGVIVIVVLGAGVITLWQGRRRQTRPTKIDLGRRRQTGHLDQRSKKSVQ